jgi:hypothetical protein
MPVRYHELMNSSVTLLLTGPVLSTLLRLSLPNVLAMSIAVLVGIAETWYVGKLGTTQLAAMALGMRRTSIGLRVRVANGMDWLATITQGIAGLCPMCRGDQDARFRRTRRGMGLRASCVVANHKAGM